MTLTTTRKSTVTANVAGKTANVVVDPESADGHDHYRADHVDCGGSAGQLHFRRRRTANIRDVTVNWGDGTSQSLGAISGSHHVSHTYTEAGTYTRPGHGDRHQRVLGDGVIASITSCRRSRRRFR